MSGTESPPGRAMRKGTLQALIGYLEEPDMSTNHESKSHGAKQIVDEMNRRLARRLLSSVIWDQWEFVFDL